MKKKQVKVGAKVRARTGPDRRIATVVGFSGAGVAIRYPDGKHVVKLSSSLERVKEDQES